MTRILSELLGAREPDFRLSILGLEEAHGRPSADIRLTTEVQQLARRKLQELGLDPGDTTAEELYQALQERIKMDDARLEKTLRTLAATYISAEGDAIAGTVHALQQIPLDKSCYALKASAAKKLLKQQSPKRVMRQLGYRSLESMLKHESIAAILAGAWLVESPAWRRDWIERYKTVSPRDFEMRPISILSPRNKKWTQLANSAVARTRHNVISFKEVGAVVLLPLPADKPAGATTATLALALHALNDIRASSTFLKLCQVRGDFGRVVQTVASGEPYLSTHVLDRPVPWHIIQRYYARAKKLFHAELFEPYIQANDFSWHAVEKALSHIEPSFAFWEGTSHLGWLHNSQPVTLNVLDAALNYCNRLPFINRIVHYGRSSLWHELTLRYLKQDSVERAVTSELQPELATEEVLL